MKANSKENKTSRKYVNILGIKVDSTPKDELLTQIENKLSNKIQFVIVTPNPEIILEANNKDLLKEVLNNADFAIPDGVGLGMKVIKGRQFMLDLFNVANEKKLKVYILGSNDEVIQKSLNKIKAEFPNITVKGNNGPQLDKKAVPVSKRDISLQSEVVKEINNFKPDLLFVAFGAPKQELWIGSHISKLNVIGVMAVGGSLDYYSGAVRKVPNLFKNSEWLWRLINEPWRIKRIFNAVIVFPLKVALSAGRSKNQD